MINIKNIALVARSEYVRWMFNPKMLLLVVVFLIMRDSVFIPMISASNEMDSPINLLEPCIAMINSWVGLMLFVLGYMFLISSFPTADTNMLFYISRMGRRNWILGEILFQIMSTITYSILITFITVVQIVNKSFFSNGWSLVVTDYDKLYTMGNGIKMSNIIPPDLFFQMTPFKAYIFSFGLFSLFLMLCGMSFLTGCLFQKRILIFIIHVIHITVGCALMLVNSNAMWFFPISHSILKIHYHGYFRKYIFSPYISLALFIVLLMFVGGVMYRKSRKVSIDMIGGDVLL